MRAIPLKVVFFFETEDEKAPVVGEQGPVFPKSYFLSFETLPNRNHSGATWESSSVARPWKGPLVSPLWKDCWQNHRFWRCELLMSAPRWQGHGGGNREGWNEMRKPFTASLLRHQCFSSFSFMPFCFFFQSCLPRCFTSKRDLEFKIVPLCSASHGLISLQACSTCVIQWVSGECLAKFLGLGTGVTHERIQLIRCDQREGWEDAVILLHQHDTSPCFPLAPLRQVTGRWGDLGRALFGQRHRGTQCENQKPKKKPTKKKKRVGCDDVPETRCRRDLLAITALHTAQRRIRQEKKKKTLAGIRA